MAVDITDSTAKDVRVLIYGTKGDEKRFLLVQRAEGGYSLPGGYKNTDDADLRIVATRALKDALGLDEFSYTLKDTELAGEDTEIYTDPVSGIRKDISVHLFVARYNGEQEIKPSADIQRALWFKESSAQTLFAQEHMERLFMHGAGYC